MNLPILLLAGLALSALSATGLRAQQLSQPAPAFVVFEARRTYQKVRAEVMKETEELFLREFPSGFFGGFTNPEGDLWAPSKGGYWYGFRSGQQYRRSHPDEVASVFAAFGYTEVSSDGVWRTGPEQSGFRPSSGFGKEEWWLASLSPRSFEATPEEEAERKKKGRSYTRMILVAVRGYVSAAGGGYGHMGIYDREFWAISIERKKE